MILTDVRNNLLFLTNNMAFFDSAARVCNKERNGIDAHYITIREPKR